MPKPSDNWSPPLLMQALGRLSAQEFEDRLRGCPVLLIRLADTDAPFRSMLATSTRPRTLDAAAPVEPMEYSTALLTSSTPESDRPLPDLNDRDRQELLKVQRLIPEPTFVVPLSRTESADGVVGRMTVGRNRNHDIVLRDASVSKLHAALRVSRLDVLTVRDMGSKNHTYLNGEEVGAEWQTVAPGDTLVFGTIRTLVCSPAALYGAMRR